MQKIVAILLVFIMAISCVACDSEGRGTPEVEEAIKQTFLDTFETDDSIKTKDLSLKHYGCYDGAYVVFVDGPYMYMDVMRTERIGGMTFTFGSSQKLYVYKDGEMKTLLKAYYAGWLSDEALTKIHKYFS